MPILPHTHSDTPVLRFVSCPMISSGSLSPPSRASRVLRAANLNGIPGIKMVMVI